MAEGVVHTLEVVEVDGNERKRKPVGQACEGALQLAAVGEPGQRVGQRLLFEQVVVADRMTSAGSSEEVSERVASATTALCRASSRASSTVDWSLLRRRWAARLIMIGNATQNPSSRVSTRASRIR